MASLFIIFSLRSLKGLVVCVCANIFVFPRTVFSLFVSQRVLTRCSLLWKAATSFNEHMQLTFKHYSIIIVCIKPLVCFLPSSNSMCILLVTSWNFIRSAFVYHGFFLSQAFYETRFQTPYTLYQMVIPRRLFRWVTIYLTCIPFVYKHNNQTSSTKGSVAMSLVGSSIYLICKQLLKLSSNIFVCFSQQKFSSLIVFLNFSSNKVMKYVNTLYECY